MADSSDDEITTYLKYAELLQAPRKVHPVKKLQNAWKSVKRFNQQSLERLVRNSPRLSRRFNCAAKKSSDKSDHQLNRPIPSPLATIQPPRISTSQPNLVDYESNPMIGSCSPSIEDLVRYVANEHHQNEPLSDETDRNRKRFLQEGRTSKSVDQLINDGGSRTRSAETSSRQGPDLDSSSAHSSRTGWLQKPSMLMRMLRPGSSHATTEPKTLVRTTDSAEEYLVSYGDDDEPSCSNEINRKTNQRRYPFYLMKVHLISARNLPTIQLPNGEFTGVYIKFMVANRMIHCSRLSSGESHPHFDEQFQLPIEDLDQKVELFTMERGLERNQTLCEKCLATAVIDPNKLKFYHPTKLHLETDHVLKRSGLHRKHLTFELNVTLVPKTIKDRELYYAEEMKLSAKKTKTQQWDSVVNIVLVEGNYLSRKSGNQPPDAYVRFRLLNERYKTKVAHKTSHPCWNEQFNLYTFSGQNKSLDIHVFNDKDDEILGYAVVNLFSVTQDETHEMHIPLLNAENNPSSAELVLFLTVSGIRPSDEMNQEQLPTVRPLSNFSLMQTLKDVKTVGMLEVIVHRAENLLAMDFGGKSDPFAELEIGNLRVRTQTVYCDLNPEWNRSFFLKILDIHEVLTVTLYDEDSNKKVEFLGCVCIPLLKITNERKWFLLKDKELRSPTKGRLLLSFNLQYNVLRACYKTIRSKDAKVTLKQPRFKRAIFMNNLRRLNLIYSESKWISKFYNRCLNWESKPLSLTALILFCLVTHYFQPFMIPLAFLLLLSVCYLRHILWGGDSRAIEQANHSLPDDSEEDDQEDNQDRKKNFTEKVKFFVDTIQFFQNSMGSLASFIERLINTANCSVPFLSKYAIILLLLITSVLYFVPIRYVILMAGLNKFYKKYRCPRRSSSNEFLNFISRAPDMTEQVKYIESSEPYKESDNETLS